MPIPNEPAHARFRGVKSVLKRGVAGALVALLNASARLPGERFYRFYLDDLNRRFNDFGQTEVQTVGGHQLRFVCPNRLTRWRVETLATKEPGTLAWIGGFAPGAVIWDVGANVGLYSLYAACARGCRVIAFEPTPANFALLAKNVEINGFEQHVHAFPVALGARSGIGQLSMRTTEPGSACAVLGDEDSAAKARLACLSYSVDRFIADFAPPFPQHIKIDVDGAEEGIVEGAEQTLADARLLSLLIECDDRLQGAAAGIAARLAHFDFRQVESYRSPLFPDSPAHNVHFVRG